MTRHFMLAAALVATTAASAQAQSISLTLRDGRVTLITQNASPAAILAEWARLGQVRIVDGERVPGAPLTLQLQNVPEREALDIVLRGAAGYVAAPRAQHVATLSRFDRVMVMPTSPGAATARAASAISRPNAGAVVQNAPVQVEEPVAVAGDTTPSVAAAPEDAQNVSNAVEQPASSTNFDYANPQRYFAARQAEQQANDAAAGGQVAQPAAATANPNNIFGATRSTPGVLPTPQPQGQAGATGNAGNGGNAPVNPYGLPSNQQPGSAQAPPMEPDRAKYINPYSPTPPRP